MFMAGAHNVSPSQGVAGALREVEVAMVTQKFTGETISPGAVKGRLVFFQSDYEYSFSAMEEAAEGDAQRQIARFEDHVEFLVQELAEAVYALESESATEEAEILRTHIYIVKDPKFHQDVRREIVENKRAAETAIEATLHKMIAALESSKNELMSQRAGDVRDILSRLGRRVNQQSRQAFEALRGTGAIVLATRELLPSIVLEARHSSVVGFVIERGSGLSHAAILAKSLGFPTIRIDDLQALAMAGDQEILIDATNGSIIVAPGAHEVVQSLDPTSAMGTLDRATLPARLWVNVADPGQVSSGLLERVEGVGLYRTEVLFMEQTDDFPSEQQQYEVYKSLFETCRPDRPVTVRTADIGGDKTLPYFSFGSKENPYLSIRALRVYREHPEIFIVQMRAILRAAVNASGLRVMYPMVASVEDMAFLHKLLAEVVRSLEARREIYQRNFQQGIMIEVPSAVWNCKELLDVVDFASVGTNDLLQYFFAVNRDDIDATQGYRVQNPVALQMLKHIVECAARAGKSLSICGEIASDPQLVPLLIGLGFRDLSVDVHFVSQIERIISDLDVAACERLANQCLKAHSSQEVRTLLSSSVVARECAGNGGASGHGRVVDPVCEILMDIVDSSLTITREGRTLYFCSARCRDEYFRRELYGVPREVNPLGKLYTAAVIADGWAAAWRGGKSLR
jgi:phosphotransferase system enzyme I (PtsI)